MQVSHETPLQLLNLSLTYNDYDYALVHLFEKSNEYFHFMKNSVKDGRRVLLDCSTFELGEAFHSNEYAAWIERLLPTEYIIPDVLNNCDKTIENAIEWNKDYKHLPGKKMCVIQGNTYNELVKCYKEIYNRCDKIGINFAYPYYQSVGIGSNKWQKAMTGRTIFIENLIKDEVIDFSKSHHLLGMGLPQEIMARSFYKKFDTLDTSNPVLHGLMGIRYKEDGLYDKNTTMLNSIFFSKFNSEKIDDLLYNVRKFKEFKNIAEKI